MQFVIDGVLCEFLPIGEFRAQHALPHDFGIGLFMRHGGQGRMDNNALTRIKADMLQAVHPTHGWMALTLELQLLFRAKLLENRPFIGLSTSEINYAVVGLGQVCQAYVHAMYTARMSGQPAPPFDPVYNDWLNHTVQVARAVFTYPHKGKLWSIRPIKHAYGLMGMVVKTPDDTYYVYDAGISCPAQHYMAVLLRDVTARMAEEGQVGS
jgi:hypothetical protein